MTVSLKTKDNNKNIIIKNKTKSNIYKNLQIIFKDSETLRNHS